MCLGDCEGQLTSIADKCKDDAALRAFPRSRFMHDLCNGLWVQLNTYRRGSDYTHYLFMRSIYPSRGGELTQALQYARERYPMQSTAFSGVSLCVSHRRRIEVSTRANEERAPPDAVLVRAVHVGQHDNQPQDFKAYMGLIVVAAIRSSTEHIKNGCQYKNVDIVKDADGSCVSSP